MFNHIVHRFRFPHPTPVDRHGLLRPSILLVTAMSSFLLAACTTAQAGIILTQATIRTNDGLESHPFAISRTGPLTQYIATSSVLPGVLRSLTHHGSPASQLTGFPLSQTRFVIRAVNTTTTAWNFSQGDIFLDVAASYTQIPGFPGGSARNNVESLLQVDHTGGQAVAIIKHDVVVRGSNPTDIVETLSPGSSGGGGVNVLGADDKSLRAILFMPAFTVDPGRGFTITAFLNTQAVASNQNSNGWESITNAANSAHLSLTLPEGVSRQEFSGNLPLEWVHERQASPVPEPSSIALFGLGILGLIGTSARRRKARSAVI